VLHVGLRRLEAPQRQQALVPSSLPLIAVIRTAYCRYPYQLIAGICTSLLPSSVPLIAVIRTAYCRCPYRLLPSSVPLLIALAQTDRFWFRHVTWAVLLYMAASDEFLPPSLVRSVRADRHIGPRLGPHFGDFAQTNARNNNSPGGSPAEPRRCSKGSERRGRPA
jgi:hypothetical protein